jgi:hypothetical protein
MKQSCAPVLFLGVVTEFSVLIGSVHGRNYRFIGFLLSTQALLVPPSLGPISTYVYHTDSVVPSLA